MSGLELALFGGFHARLDGRTLVNFRSAKTQGLLIYLALTERRTHQRDALAGLLWPDAPETVAKKNLRQSLYRLGGLLNHAPATPDSPYLMVTRTTVCLDPNRPVWVDVDAYRAKLAQGALEAAVECFRDDVLPGFECGSEPFDDWLRSERQDLQLSLLEALSRLTEERLFRGDHAGAADLARRQLRLQAWREQAHRQLMRSLVLAGDRGAAIAQFETCRRVLSTELDIEPAPATTRLVRRIRDNDLTQPARGSIGVVDAAESTHFVGRSDALAALGEALRRSMAGRTELVVVVGAAGAGKSALAARFLARAAGQGADVLYAHALATRAGLAYQPISSLLRRRIETENAPDDLLSDVWLSQLSRLLPELRERYPDLRAPSQDHGSASHLLEAIARLGAALAQRRHAVLFIDDVHWADSASLDALAYAARRWNEQSVPMLVLITVRPENVIPSAPLADWLDQLGRVAATTRLDLQPLSALETHQLAEALLGGRLAGAHGPSGERAAWLRTVGDWLHTRTGGHPLLVTETIKALDVSKLAVPDRDESSAESAALTVDEKGMTELVTPALRSVVEPWLTRISPAGRTVLTAASVLAENASLDQLRTLTDLPEAEFADAIDELVSAQLLEESAAAQSPDYRFSHELVRELIDDMAGPARRRLLHRRALDALRSSGVSAARLVRHALRAGSPGEAFELSVTAAEDAMEDLAAGVAVEHFSAARQIAETYSWPSTPTSTDRTTVLLGLARALELTEQWTEAEQTYRSALTLARETEQPAIERRILIRLAQTAYHSTDPDRRASGTAMLWRARTLAADAGDRRGMTEVDLELASIAYHGGDLTGAERLLGQAAVRESHALDRRLAARQRTLSCLIHISHRRWPEAAADAAAAAELYDDDAILAHDALRSGAYCLLQIGRPNDALVALERTLAFSREIGNAWGETECLWKLGHTHLELGHYGQALAYAREGAARAQALGVPPLYELALAVLATVQRTMFDLPGARSTLLGELARVREEMGASAVTEDWPVSELCTISRLDGDWELAADYAAQRPGLRRDPSMLTLGLSSSDAIDALLRSGDAVSARDEVRRLETAAAGNDRYQVVLLRSQAVLAVAAGAGDQEIAHLRDALHLTRRLGLPGEEWPILCALAPALKAGGDDETALGMMRDAARIIDRLAATIEDADVRQRFIDTAHIEAGFAETSNLR